MKIPTELLASLAREEGVALVLDASLRIRHVNPAWAKELLPGGITPPPASMLEGRHYLEFVHGPMRAKLEQRFARVLQSSSARAEVLVSECNTTTEIQLLTTHIIPLRAVDSNQPSGVVVLQSLVGVGSLRDRYVISEESVDAWRSPEGLLVQCGCCCRARDARDGAWRMNTSLLAAPAPENMSHGLCEMCLEAYFGEE